MNLRNALLLFLSLIFLAFGCSNEQQGTVDEGTVEMNESPNVPEDEPGPVNQETAKPEIEASQNLSDLINIKDIKTPVGFTLYQNPTEGIALNYPESWTINTDNMASVVMFMSPKTSDADRFQENININIEDPNPPIYSIREYTDASVNGIKMVMEDSRILSRTDLVISGLPAQLVVYTAKFNNEYLTWHQVYVLKGSRAWIITGTCLENTYGSYRPKFEKAIGSFVFVE